MSREAAGFRVETTAGGWRARAVVIATGACGLPARPRARPAAAGSGRAGRSRRLPRPGRAAPRAACWWSAPRRAACSSPSEIHRSGRPVTLAAGRHTCGCRGATAAATSCAGSTRAGMLDEDWRSVPDLAAARRQPSMQLAGPRRRSTSPGSPGSACASPARLAAVEGGSLRFADSLPADCRRLRRPARPAARAHRRLDRRGRRCGTAGPAARRGRCGCRPSRAPALDLAAERHRAPWSGPPATGATTAGCACRCSTPTASSATRAASRPRPASTCSACAFLRRRSSSFLAGVGADAEAIAAEVAAHLARRLAA